MMGYMISQHFPHCVYFVYRFPSGVQEVTVETTKRHRILYAYIGIGSDTNMHTYSRIWIYRYVYVYVYIYIC